MPNNTQYPEKPPLVEEDEININHINNPHDKYVRGLLQNPKLASFHPESFILETFFNR